MPSIEAIGNYSNSSRVLIVSLTLPYNHDPNNNNDDNNHKPVHNHPALLVGRGIENKMYIGMSDAEIIGSKRVVVDEDERRSHFRFCKERLWPLLHYSIWDKPLLDVGLEKSLYQAFEVVNERFCEAVAEEFQPGDLVIIIGYHLSLLPGLLKKHTPSMPIAYFIKCPVSSSEYIKCLPQAKQVVRGALGANLVIVQSDSYARHCASFCLRIMDMEKENIVNGNVRIVDNYGEVEVELTNKWLGIDVEKAVEMRTSYGVLEKVNELRKLFASETKIFLGIDGADQLRGVVHKLEAFKLFLETYTDHVGKVVLLQICIPEQAIEDKETESKVNELVNAINQRFGTLSYTPVHYHQRHIGEDEYFALLSSASVYLNTVERDSIPLVCLDFVICQQGLDESQCGVLIMSGLTALADYLPHVHTVNPWHTVRLAETMMEAITIGPIERKEMIAKSMRVICEADAKLWAPQVIPQLQKMLTPKTPLLEKDYFKDLYQRAKRRIFFIDYDGTLTPIVTSPEDAVPSSRCLEVLSRLTDDPMNQVYVISGRSQASLVGFLGNVPKLGLSAEHGSFLRRCEHRDWSTTVAPPLTSAWRDQVMSVFSHYTDRTPGSHIEEKALSVTWHYRQADPDYGVFQAADCVDSLHGLFPEGDGEGRRVDILQGKKNIEVKMASANKGHIVRSILSSSPVQYDLVVCFGDDTTDEDMFEVLRDLPCAVTCTVGAANKKTTARFHVPNCNQLLSLLHFAMS